MTLVAKVSFVAVVDGRDVEVRAGVTRVAETDELAELYPDNFTPDRRSRPEVEQATNAPGEKR